MTINEKVFIFVQLYAKSDVFMSSMKKEITLINDYQDGIYSTFSKKIKNGLSLRDISVQTAVGGHYYSGMVWGGDFKSSDILMLLHSKLSSCSGEIQSIVKWVRDNKKTLIIVTLDDTPLTGAWELIFTDYKQYQIIKYNEENPNKTIFEIEESLKEIESKKSFSKLNYLILIFVFVFSVLVSIWLVVDTFDSEDGISKIIIAFIYSVCWITCIISCIIYGVYGICLGVDKFLKNKKKGNKLQQQMQMPRKSDKVQPTLADNKKIEYKCFIAGATTITEERDAVRASLSQVVNRWGSLDIMLSSFTFEDFDNNHQQQMRYDEFIQNEADCVIVIITDGIGPKTIGEYRLAVSTLQKTKKRPKVVVYADEKSKNDPDVVEFKKEVENNKTYWVSYTSLNELKEKIQNEMTKQLLPIVQEIIKKS